MLVLAKLPRDSMPDIPDWGTKEEFWIPTVNEKKMECWVDPQTLTALRDFF